MVHEGMAFHCSPEGHAILSHQKFSPSNIYNSYCDLMSHQGQLINYFLVVINLSMILFSPGGPDISLYLQNLIKTRHASDFLNIYWDGTCHL